MYIYDIYIYIYIYIPAENDVIDKQINSNYGFSIGNPDDVVIAAVKSL